MRLARLAVVSSGASEKSVNQLGFSAGKERCMGTNFGILGATDLWLYLGLFLFRQPDGIIVLVPVCIEVEVLFIIVEQSESLVQILLNV